MQFVQWRHQSAASLLLEFILSLLRFVQNALDQSTQVTEQSHNLMVTFEVDINPWQMCCKQVLPLSMQLLMHPTFVTSQRTMLLGKKSPV